jgi:tRNA-dihydrouridine synthase
MTSFLLYSAPLEDVSDSAYRTLCYTYGADLTFSEMTRLQGLAKHNKATWSRVEQYDDTPTVIQLLAGKEEQLEQFLKEFKPKPGFRGINFNMGCPSPDVIKLGLGCAFLKRVAKAQRLVLLVKKYGYEVSVKLRLGLNKYEASKEAYLHLIKNVDADFFILHARHGAQTYDDPPDWSHFVKAVATKKKIIANGDIYSLEQIEKLKAMGCAGAMIGRAAVYNPAIFMLLKDKKIVPSETIAKKYSELAKQYNTKPRYQDNVLTRLGRDPSSIVNKPSYQG